MATWVQLSGSEVAAIREGWAPADPSWIQLTDQETDVMHALLRGGRVVHLADGTTPIDGGAAPSMLAKAMPS
jgi:hypothetical protein